MAKKVEEITEETRKIDGLSLRELLDLREGLNCVFDYYYNQFMSNNGEYDISKEQQQKIDRKTFEKYGKLKSIVFDKIEEKINEII